MEIDKDKIVELVAVIEDAVQKALSEPTQPFYLQAIEDLMACPQYKAVKESLNPPPSRPSKEKCIEYLKEFIECIDTQDELFIKAAIGYLKEPSLQWVKNTGVVPKYEVALLVLEDEKFCLSDTPGLHDWSFTSEARVIKKYIILE